MLLPARSLSDATLGWLFQVWDEVCTDMEHVDEITKPVQPPAARAALHASITDDFTSVRDELTRRLQLARNAAKHLRGHDGAIYNLPPEAIREIHERIIPPD
jgi:hypothetical protein